MVCHAIGVVAEMWRVAGEIPREGGVAVYMTQCGGRGATFPMSTRDFLFGGRMSNEAADRRLGGRVSEVITPDVGMCPDFM